MVNEGLNSMSALLIFDEISQLWCNRFQYLQSLKRCKDCKQFLDHVVAVLMHDELSHGGFGMGNDHLDVAGRAEREEILKYSGLYIVLHKLG
jgi:hypothetical protein